MGGEGSNENDGLKCCLLVSPKKARVKKVVTRLLATTCVLKQYSRGEEIKNTNRAHTRVTATKRWRPTGCLKIFVEVGCYVSRQRLPVLSCFLG